MVKKTLTSKEIFCGMPYLQNYFRQMERKIKLFTPEEGKCEEVERLKKERKELLERAKNIDIEDLRILYYLHKLKKIFPAQLLAALKKFYGAQEEFIEFLNDGEVKH